MIELAILAILLILLLVSIQRKWIAIEGFTDEIKEGVQEGFASDDAEYRLSACPTGFTTFYDSQGNIMCCDGEMTGNICLQGKQCTLSNTGPNSCVSLLRSHFTEKARDQCPPSMQMYFEDAATKQKGCTAGRLLPEMNGPLHSSQPTCKIYATLQENLNAKDSCHNQRKMEEFPCFGQDCCKEIVQTKPDAPAMVAVHFTDPTGMFHISYTRDSMENYLNHTKPRWRDEGLDLTKNVHVAEVAKAYYVDKTIQDVQI